MKDPAFLVTGPRGSLRARRCGRTLPPSSESKCKPRENPATERVSKHRRRYIRVPPKQSTYHKVNPTAYRHVLDVLLTINREISFPVFRLLSLFWKWKEVYVISCLWACASPLIFRFLCGPCRIKEKQESSSTWNFLFFLELVMSIYPTDTKHYF
jgi:hypothetical protein